MRDARTPVPRPPEDPPPTLPPPAPCGATRYGRDADRARRRCLRPVISVALAGLAAAMADTRPAEATVSVGVLLRRARYALAEGDTARASGSLQAACAAEPGSARGIEAALLLAALEFSRGDRAAAERALDASTNQVSSSPGANEALALARGWIALGGDDPASARRAFASVVRSGDPSARDLSKIGEAWAELVGGDPGAAITALSPVAVTAADPALRLAARWTLARAYAAAGDRRREQHELRALRRFARSTSFADDVELAIALSEIDDTRPRSARRTLLRLQHLPARSSGPPRNPGDAPSLDDLRLPPRAFVARLATLFAHRPLPAEPPFEFLRRALDRDARADAGELLHRLASAEGGAR